MVLTSTQKLDLTALTVLSLFACLIFVVLRGAMTLTRADVRNAKINLRSQLGQANWDFTQNFATNTGVIGSALTLLLTSGALPTGPQATKILPTNTYAGLAVFFGTLVIIAPLLYNGTATRVNVSASDETDTACEYRGRVWGFLVAALATTWGLVGSFATMFVALMDLYYAGSLSGLAVGLLGGVLAISVIFFTRYSWLKIDGTIRDQYGLSAREAQTASGGTATAKAELAAGAPRELKPNTRLTML